MLDKLEDKKQRIKEEFEKYEIEPLEGLESRLNTTRNNKARSQRAEERKDKRTKKVNGASLVFLLKDNDIYEDISTMRRVSKINRISRHSNPKKWERESIKLLYMCSKNISNLIICSAISSVNNEIFAGASHFDRFPRFNKEAASH